MVKTRQQIAAMEKVGDYMAQEPSLEYSQATGELGSPSSKHLSAKRSHHSSSSSTKTVQKLAVIVEHARKQANLEAERERVAAERERVAAEHERVAAERERAVAELELQAQLAAIEDASASGSRHSHSIVDLWLDKNNVLGVPQNLVIDSTQKVVPMQPTEALGSVQPPTVARPVCLCATASTKVSHMQLPNFDGKSNDWLIFRRIYEDTKPVFSPAENLIRLSGALRGAAKEAVTTLLIAANDPDQVIEALQRRFGQSEVIVIQEVAKIKALPKINLSDSGKQVSDFACKVRNCVETIKLLKQREYLFSPELCNAIIGKLPVSMQVQWAHFAFKMNNENFSKLELLSEFLDHEADIRNRFGYITTSDISNVNTNIKGSKFNYYSTSFQNVDAQLNKKFTYKVNNIFCYFCKSSQHNTTDCQEFLNLSVEDRWLWVKEKKVCYHCLKKGGHKYISCKPTQRCGVQGCMKKHHELLHIISPPTCNENTNNSDVVTHSSTLSPPSAFPKPLLKIIGVTLSGPLGKIDTFALLDDGSTGTFIDADIAKIIGASGPSTLLQMKCISGLSKEAQVQVVDFDIKGQNSNVTYHVRNARSIKDLNLGAQRSLSIDDLKLYSHLADLTDKVSYYENAKPMLLLGIDNWHLIISKETRRGRKSEPVASLTALGWVLFGFRNSRTDSVEFVNQCTSERSNDLDIIIQDYYNLDSIGITKKDLYSADDKRAIRILDDTIRHLPNGRFEVGLLWRNDNMDIPNSSYNLALNRFKSLENKFMKDTSYAELYRRNIQATIDKGYVEPCLSEPTSSSFTWYLPHFGVMNQNKPGKLRVVHDAAANCEGISLNSLLLPGPVLLQSLFDILLRFREGKIALSADIREMFPQIKIRAEDRDAQRFLWRQSVDAPITSFRMSSMIFGAASSPFTALYVKNKNALEYKTEYPNAVDAIIKNHYMDDYLGSLDDINSAAEIARDIIFIHKQACFEMRSWVTNFPEVLKFVPPDFQLNNGCDINLGNFPQSVRTLGLIWHHNTDCIGFNINKSNKISYTFTKRNVLSQLMRIFDPLGLLTPLTIKGRILFQRAWRKGLYWDQELSSDDQIKWKHWFSDVEAVQFLKIPRWYITNEDSSIINNENVVDRELHVFSDASQSAYAAVAYWRFVFRDQSIRTSLICSRARVSPLKPISIPRLELQGALIAARLAATICLAVVHKPTKRFFWCDSKNVLAWLRNDACNFKPFIAHRVGEILEITARKEWRWVPTKFNVADDATRFQSTRLSLIDRWFSGPKFLFLETNAWPAETDTHLIPIIELKKSAKLVDVNLINETITKNPVVADPVRFSSWLRFLRTTAYVHKYVKRLKLLVIKKKGLTLTSQPCNGSGRDTPALVDLTAEDLMSARLQVLRSCQADSFNRELRCLQTGTPLPQDNKLRNLEISLAEDGLMRLSGRIEASTFQTEDLNKPIILDGDHRIVHLLILHYHIKFAHANNETILNEMRQQFFIFRLRSIIKKVCHSCQFCKNRKATVCCPSFGNLPAARLAHHYRPFTFTGLDYFGPVIVCVGRRTEKRYVALFTCLSTRAIHLEVVNSLSADSAILALRRFIARRGTPQEIWSDNGTSFVGANKELKAFYGDAISNTAANLNIHWHFIPPASPFMGGAWERLVRSVKQALKVTLLQKHPQEQILWTLLTEAENIVNSRPLTYIPTDATEEALTPNHFLLGTSSGAQIPVSLTDRDLCGRSDWKKAIRLSDHFWRRWIKEYLPTLVPRRSASTDHRNLSVGDIVVIVDANLPRGSWPKGRISAVFPGKDGSVRIADVTTEAGTLRRPAKKIIRLPI